MFLSVFNDHCNIITVTVLCSNCEIALKLFPAKYDVGNALISNLAYFQRGRFEIHNFVIRLIKFFDPCPFFLSQVTHFANVG